MRTLVVGFALFAISTVGVCHAEDMDYQLPTSDAEMYEEQKLSESFSIEIKNRVWVTKGIEERTTRGNLKEIKEPKPQRFRIERAPDRECHVSYLMDFSNTLVTFEAPTLIDDSLWPRTREEFRDIDRRHQERHAWMNCGYTL
jgi:hypothetical protein